MSNRLIITSTTHRPRRTLSTLRALPSYIVAPTLFLPTILHSLMHPILTLSTPLVLRTRFMIDRDISPSAFSVAKFVSSSIALLVKLPLETILRRGQVHVLSSPEYVRALEGNSNRKRASAALEDAVPALDAVVPLGGYNGVVGTVYSITSEEGSRAVSSKSKNSALARKGKAKIAETIYRRGQGLDGLWRGWKVSWWGLVGLWAAGVVGGGGDGEF
jgi:mitochondrial fusion and transport protein UGO1